MADGTLIFELKDKAHKKGILFQLVATLLEDIYNLLKHKRPLEGRELKAKETVLDLCEAITKLEEK